MRIASTFVMVLLGSALAGCGGEKPLAEFKDPGGKFKILFPGTPKSEKTKGIQGVEVTVLSVEGGAWAYTLNYYDIPANVPDTDNAIRIALFHEVSGIYDGLKGENKDQSFSNFQDRYVLAEHEGTVTKPKSMHIRGRSYIIANRVYNVMVLGSADKIKSETATKFLDSFKVIEPVHEGDEK